VLHIHTLPVVSGSGINTFLSMKGLDTRVWRAELACAPGGRLVRQVEDHGMKVRPIRHFVQPFAPLRDLASLIEVSRLLHRHRYHIIHTHNSKAGFIGRLAAKLARVPVVVHTVHGFAFHDQERPWRRLLYRNLERVAMHWCDRMIFISQPLVRWAEAERILPPGSSKAVQIFSGIELERFRPVDIPTQNRIRARWHLESTHAVIGIVSKLWDGKGHAVLIQAFARLFERHPESRLVIVGEGYLLNRLKRQARELGIGDAVLFTGFQRNVPNILASFDVAVLPSFFEGMGRALLEAMAMAKPVVASRVGGIPDIVYDGINGFLVTPGNVEELAVAIEKLLLNKDLAVQMGKAGRQHIGREFSADFMAQSIEKVYRELLGEKRIECDR